MMEMTQVERLLHHLWNLYGSSISEEMDQPIINNSSIVNEFFFIILGGYGISFEQNTSGLAVLKKKGFLDSRFYCSKLQAEETIVLLRKELRLPQFGPFTKDGGLRKYRFIETKPCLIANAGLWLWEGCNWNILEKITSMGVKEARIWLCQCPGIGIKSASWLLRNTGLDNDCAVFDVHILRFLKKIGIDIPDKLDLNAYVKLEEIFRAMCKKIDVPLGNMDYLLWVLGRNGYLAYVEV